MVSATRRSDWWACRPDSPARRRRESAPGIYGASERGGDIRRVRSMSGGGRPRSVGVTGLTRRADEGALGHAGDPGLTEDEPPPAVLVRVKPDPGPGGQPDPLVQDRPADLGP